MSCSDYPALAVLGPTGSDKTRLSMALALRFGGEIVSCDALQVYRGMDIGTAKASPAERAAVPHYLLNLREPGENFSAGDYMRLGRLALGAISERDRIPLVAGGTGFYFRALVDGLFQGPGRSEGVRARLRRIVERRGSASLHRVLGRVDPEAARRIAPGDAARVLRACEVWFVSGRPLTWWQQQPCDSLSGYRWLKLGIAWPRPALYERIDARVVEMFDRGFVEEVRALLSRYPRDCHAFKAIGYRQVARHLDGEISLAEAIHEMQKESRHYAKRQLTWFRSLPDIRWLDAARGWTEVEAEALNLAGSHLDNVVF